MNHAPCHGRLNRLNGWIGRIGGEDCNTELWCFSNACAAATQTPSRMICLGAGTVEHPEGAEHRFGDGVVCVWLFSPTLCFSAAPLHSGQPLMNAAQVSANMLLIEFVGCVAFFSSNLCFSATPLHPRQPLPKQLACPIRPIPLVAWSHGVFFAASGRGPLVVCVLRPLWLDCPCLPLPRRIRAD